MCFFLFLLNLTSKLCYWDQHLFCARWRTRSKSVSLYLARWEADSSSGSAAPTVNETHPKNSEVSIAMNKSPSLKWKFPAQLHLPLKCWDQNVCWKIIKHFFSRSKRRMKFGSWEEAQMWSEAMWFRARWRLSLLTGSAGHCCSMSCLIVGSFCFVVIFFSNLSPNKITNKSLNFSLINHTENLYIPCSSKNRIFLFIHFKKN